MDRSQREELGRQLLAFQPEVVVKGKEDPEEVLRQVLALRPQLLYYMKQYRFWRGPFHSRIQVEYRNQGYPWRQIRTPEAGEVEETLRNCVMRYQKKAVLVLPKNVNLRWILQCFMNQTVSFYPNTKSYAMSSCGFPDIPYTVYEIQFEYWLGRVMLRQMEEEVEQAVRQLAARLFPIPMPDSVRCRIAHNYLACTVEYCNEDNGSPLERSSLQSAYGALIRKKCVCQGIAEAYKRLLNQAGVPCDLISGKILDAGKDSGSRENWHAWNIVHLNGGRDHCHVDVTWDIGKGFSDKAYFLKSDADLAGQREWKRHYYTPCGDGRALERETQAFCRLHEDQLRRAGLRKEWIF